MRGGAADEPEERCEGEGQGEKGGEWVPGAVKSGESAAERGSNEARACEGPCSRGAVEGNPAPQTVTEDRADGG